MSRSSSLSTLSTLLRHLSAERRTVIAASAYSVINKLFDIAPEILIGIAVDVVARREHSLLADWGVVDPLNQVYLLGAATALIWICESLFEYLYLVHWRGLAQRVQHNLRVETYDHLQQLDLGFFERRSSGDLIAIVNDDINQLERFLNSGASQLIRVATTIVAIGAVFVVISPKLAAMAFAPIPVIVAGAFIFQHRIAPRYDKVRDMAGRVAARLANNLQGMATIKSFAAEARELEAIRRDSAEYVDANRAAIRVSSAFIPILRMAILAGFLCTFVYGGVMVLSGQMREGLYAVLVFLTQRLLWPLTDLGETVDLYERAMASTRRVLRLLDEPVAARGSAEDVRLAGAITLSGVGFAYPGHPPVLHDIDLAVAAGRTVALVGATGGGKTTLFKLLLGFVEPTAGAIHFDDRPQGEFERAALRRSIGWVAQDVYLFDGSVRDNIAYGRPDATPDEIAAAAHAASADDFIEALPRGYDTEIGERGVRLSGGQRQRIAIARAILKNPPILLLDEATSAVDNETEAAIQRSLARLAHQRTVLVIAHRLSTIVHADLICVLVDGRIVERGSHAELLAADGAYARLWKVQTGQDETDLAFAAAPVPA